MAVTFDLFVENIRQKVRSLGFKELRTAGEVDNEVRNTEGTLLIFVNSTCGCAGGIARPAAEIALKGDVVPDRLVTVFAGQDKEATERARSYFADQPPSSPSFGFFRDGKFVRLVHRSEIEGRDPYSVAELLGFVFTGSADARED